MATIEKTKYYHWFHGKASDLEKNLAEQDIVLAAERQLLGALLMDDNRQEAISACEESALKPTHFHDSSLAFPQNYNARIYSAIEYLHHSNMIGIAQYLNSINQLSRYDIPYMHDLLSKCWTYYIYPECIEVIINHRHIPAPTISGVTL